MADEEKTIIIDIEVTDIDQEIGDLNTVLKKNREEIKELSKDYDKNAKSIAKLERENKDLSASKRELIKDSEAEQGSLNKLRRQLVAQVKERNNLNKSTVEGAKRFAELQKSIKQLSSEISGFEEDAGDFRRNVGNYPELLSEATAGTNVFGVSIGGLIATLSKAINPFTAMVGVVGALGAAYLSTGRGSKDLARAQDRLSLAFSTVGNSIADLLGSGGKGPIDKLLEGFQKLLFGLASTAGTNAILAIKETIREFELAQLEADKLAKDQLNLIEIQRQIRDEERNTLGQRVRANIEAGRIIDERETASLETQQKRIDNLKTLLSLDQDNIEIQLQLKQAEFELADIREEAQGFRSEALINDLALSREGAQQRSELRRLELEEGLITVEEGSRKEFELRQQIINEVLAIELEAVGNNILARQILEQTANNERIKLEEEFLNEKLAGIVTATNKQLAAEKKLKDKAAAEDKKRDAALNKSKKSLEKQALIDVATILGQGENLQKAFALTEIGIDTGKAISHLTAASEGNPANTVTFGLAGAGQFAAGLIRIFANIASAKKFLGTSTSAGGGVSPGGAGAQSASAADISGGLLGVNASLLSQFSTAPGAASENADAASAGLADANIEVSVVEITDAQNNLNTKVGEATLGGAGGTGGAPG